MGLACIRWLLDWSTASLVSPQDYAPQKPAQYFSFIMAIKLFDSLAREMRELKPGDRDGVFRFYNCGPTVYAPAHIGNFRTFVINDVLRRLLELGFPGRVKHVRNLTDVDDRTISQARAEGRPLAEITAKWTKLF